jgi:two-component system, chemotaxis family, protein-glutamate methylesterase/glutaminase
MTPVRRVLLADDSPIFSDVLRDLLGSTPGLEVVGVAVDGAHAVELTRALRPDIVIMDVLMPVMNGLQAIEEIMASCPTPILVLSADPRGRAGELTFEALRRGALDVLPKPERWPAPPSEQAALLERIAFLASVPVIRHLQPRRLRETIPPGIPRPRVDGGSMPIEAIGIVASTGGPRALSTVLGALRSDFDVPVLVVQHLASGFTAGLCTWLDDIGPLMVREAEHGQSLRPGEVHVAPPDCHLTVDGHRRVSLYRGAAVDGHCPSGTVLLRSLARVFGPRAAGVVLTGMGRDGAAGLLELERAGAPTIAQSAASSVVDGMPSAARTLGAARHVLALDEIGAALTELARRGPR